MLRWLREQDERVGGQIQRTTNLKEQRRTPWKVVRMEVAGTRQLALLMICMTLLAQVESQKQSYVPALFVFGDSLSDNGNNNFLPSVAKANFLPYGIDFPLGPTGRFCNGRTVSDYFGEFLGIPFVPPYLNPSTRGPRVMRGVNYASAAGGILDETGRNYGGRISLSQQVSNFGNTVRDIAAQLGSAEAVGKYLSKSIFLFSFGSNDYINNYLQPSIYSTHGRYSPRSFRDLLLSEYSKQLRALYALGARKFVVSSVGPLGCIPEQLASANSNGICVASVNDLVRDFNGGLRDLVGYLNENVPRATFVFQSSSYSTVMDIINHPRSYGISVVDDGCCGVGRFHGQITCNALILPCPNRGQYVFWDAFHPTEAVNFILAKAGFAGGPADAYPINVRQLAQL